MLVWGRGYASVKNRDTDKVIWVPSRKVKPDITQKDEVTKKDEASPLFAGISDWIPWGDEQEGLQGETASNKQERPGEDTLAANKS